MRKISTLILVLTALLALPLTARAEEAVFDFQNNTLNLPVGEGAAFTDGALTAPVTVGEVTLTSVQGDAFYPAIMMKDNNDVISLNVYKNGTIRLNAAEGKALVKVVATMKSKQFSQMTASTGATTENTWEGNATEVSFAASALMSILKLEVTTADKNSETEEPMAANFDVEAADIAAFNAVEDGKVVKLALNNAVVNGIFNGAYVEDASGATVIKGISLTAGTALNGYVIGTKSTDSSIDFVNDPAVAVEYQLTATDASTFEATETVLTGTVMTGAEVCAQANYGRLVTLQNVAISGGGQNKTLTVDGTKLNIKARDYMGVLPADYTWPEQASQITGVVIYYMTGWFLMPVSAEAIVDAASGAGTATFDFANNNMDIPVGINGAATAEEVNAGDLGGKTITMDGVTLSFVNTPTMPTRYFSNNRGQHLQLIAGGQMRVTAPVGMAVTTIRSIPNPTTNSATGATTVNVTWKVSKGGGVLSDDSQTWTGNAESVRLEATGATYLNAVEVDFAPVDAGTALRADEEPDAYTEVAGLAAFAALANNTLAKVTLTDAIITAGMSSGWGYYVEDATGGAHFYCTGLEFQVGDVLNGDIYVKKNNQNAGARIAMTEETGKDGLTITADGTVTPVEGTIAEVNVATNKNRVVKLTGVAVKGSAEKTAVITDAEGNTLDVNNGSGTYFPYVYQESLASVDYASATVVGILYGSNATTNKLIPLSITADEATAISTVDTASAADRLVIYSVQGVRLGSLQRGLNIVNGKKVMSR